MVAAAGAVPDQGTILLTNLGSRTVVHCTVVLSGCLSLCVSRNAERALLPDECLKYLRTPWEKLGTKRDNCLSEVRGRRQIVDLLARPASTATPFLTV